MDATCEAVSCPRGLWEGGKRSLSFYIPQRGSTFFMYLEGWAGTSHPAWITQVQHGQGEVRKEEPLVPLAFPHPPVALSPLRGTLTLRRTHCWVLAVAQHPL